ncbi:hypothetical protein HWV62_10194 [Athelia sp. TMB]|nr:hypothetical protein HWV62_10194 [Athelia sp. TMB]
MAPLKNKKGKSKSTVNSGHIIFDDKYEKGGTFTLTGKTGSGAVETSVQNVSLGYESPPKKPRLHPPAPSAVPSTSASPSEKEKEKRSQKASVFMEEFLENFPRLLDHLLATEADERIGTPCRCAVDNPPARMVKCHDCFQSAPTCSNCFIASHALSPLHWAEKWNGTFFERVDISELGHVISLGHSGERCPHRLDNNKAINFILTDRNGIHKTKILLCDCIGAGDRFDQLMRADIFPGSVAQPTSGFTLNLLKDYHLQTVESKKSAYDFISALRRRTNNAFPADVPFLRVIRVFKALVMLKRSGQAHGIDALLPHRPKGSVIVPCFSCPEPGFNMEFDAPWVDDELRHVMTLFLTADGHFGLPRKEKIDDPDDVSLLAGRGIFPDDIQYTKYLAKVGDSPEKSTCAKLNAVDMQNKLKFRGCVITGVVAINCARHNFFRHGSMVDLQKGEKFANTDYALAQTLWLAQFIRWITLTYDINCQYGVKLVKRFEAHFPHLAHIAERLTLLIGKMHLRGHKEDCQYRYSLNYTESCGRVSGEAIEGSWGEAKQAGGSTKEMNHGHRHDTLTDFQNDWNMKKLQDLANYLYRQLQNARSVAPKMIAQFHGLCALYGKEKVEQWSKLSTKAEFKKGEWQSVYRYRDSAVPSQAAVFKNMLKADAKREAYKDGKLTTSIALFLNDGLKLRSKQRTIARAARRWNKHGDPSDLIELQQSRSRFALDLKKWRYTQQSVMPSIVDLVIHLKPDVPENEKLLLPSDLTADERQQHGLEDLACEELLLLEGEAHDALESVRQAIKYTTSLRSDKAKYARGQRLNLRAGTVVKQGEDKQNAAVTKYRHSRAAILRLGRSEADEMFPELKDSDLIMKDSTTKRKLGDSDRVQWFRARADMEAWVVEIEILEEEFRRTICGFEKMVAVWGRLASDSTKRGHSAYGMQKAAMYKRMADECRGKFVAASGAWPKDGQSLSDYIKARRPKMSFDFDDSGA